MRILGLIWVFIDGSSTNDVYQLIDCHRKPFHMWADPPHMHKIASHDTASKVTV